MKRQLTILLSLLLLISLTAKGQVDSVGLRVDSLLNTMSIKAKVGQLFMIAAYSNKDEKHQASLEALVRDYGIGGIIVMQGGPGRQRHLISRLQQASALPLLVGQDAEWGQAMRLDSTYKFPTSLTVGALQNLALVEKLGEALAYESHQTGVHMSFSPVLDVNTNPKNPIIGVRSFGSNPDEVSEKGTALIQGMERAGVLACGKHFPGHGDTQSDSHKTLPVVDRTLDELKAVEWIPFQQALQNGVGSMMIAHLNIPSLEPTGKPTSLSSKVIDDILRKEWGYNGLILTDALNMKGVSEFAPVGELEIEAFKAGNDILLFAMDVPKASAKLVAAFENGELSEAELDRRVARILTAKENSQAWLHWKMARQGTLKESLEIEYPDRTIAHEELSFNLIEQAATLLEVGTPAFPIKRVEGRFAHIAVGTDPEIEVLNEYLDRYAKFDHFVNVCPKGLLRHEAIVLSFHQDPKSPWKRYKLTASEKALIAGLKAAGKPVYVLHFANPYGLLTYPDLGENARVLVMYENNAIAQKLGPQFLFGARSTKGKLPVDLNKWGLQGSGEASKTMQRLSYGFPSEVGVEATKLLKIDSIMHFAIDQEATPGGQILIARRGTVIYSKEFGHHTYEQSTAVEWEHLYDIASITKITATLPGIMKWYEKQPLLLESTVGQQLPELAFSNKGSLVLADVLAHQSGLAAWIPYYLRTIETDSARAFWYTAPNAESVAITSDMHLRGSVKDTMFAMLERSDLKTNDYRYSDLGYYLFQRMLERHNNENLDSWAHSTFYHPLGASRLTYNPLNKGYRLDEIVPTEEDYYWRNTTVHGSVHDMGAAMMGGVAGHAGLFANANSLAKMMQMYLWGGTYGEIKFFEPSTIEKFTSCAFCELKNRRGLGFDRPQIDEGPGPSCTCASNESFGHTGFTGTMVWMDPKEELLYIFLSNRTYPDMENWKLSKFDIRTNIQEVIYSALN